MSCNLSYYLCPEAKANGITFAPPRALDAGFDLPCLNPITIEPMSRAAVRTGLHIAIPEGWVGLVRDRSSVALKGVMTLAGVIDSAYRGELKIVMYNSGPKAVTFASGERIAQCLVIPHLVCEVALEVESLDLLGATERGDGGFGSTGA